MRRRRCVSAFGAKTRVEILIKNTANETVIGGSRPAVEEVVAVLKCPFFPLSTVSTVHCSIGREVQKDYRALHDVETRAPEGIAFYSGVSCRSYAVDRQSAADAIAAQSSGMIDFPALVERAYEDGVRVFVEVGPGNSCSRLIGQILGRRAHLAVSACRAECDPLTGVLDVLGRLIAERVPVNLASLYGRVAEKESLPTRSSQPNPASRSTIRVEVRGGGFRVPAVPSGAAAVSVPAAEESPEQGGLLDDEWTTRFRVVRSMLDAERATAEAHRAFLKVSSESAAAIAKHAAFELELIDEFARRGSLPARRAGPSSSGGSPAQPDRAVEPPVAFDRRACLEFAVGTAAAVLGPDYATVDDFPTRVRLPDEPLMLVDRVLAIEGVPRSMQGGRIVTEHVVRSQAWYLDAGRIVPSIAIEAGQADLLLCRVPRHRLRNAGPRRLPAARRQGDLPRRVASRR